MGLLLLQMIVGFCLLALGAHTFIQGARRIARLAQVPPVIVGIVLVGLGTSFPELAVSFIAAFKGHMMVSIGNVVGSNITNMGLVLGLTAMVVPLQVVSDVMRYDMPAYLVVMVLVGVLFYAGQLSRWSGVLLLLLLFCYLFWLLQRAWRARPQDYDHHVERLDAKHNTWFAAISLWVFGLVMVLFSAHGLVSGAVRLAQHFHWSELVIGLTIVAVGTALPELAATLLSAFHQEHDIALGNVIGSNIFNLLAVLAMPALFSPKALPAHLFSRDYAVMVAFSLVLVLMIYLPRRHLIGRLSGLALLSGFMLYMTYLFRFYLSVT